MQDYELITVLSPILSQEEANSLRERVKELVSRDGGDISHEETWGTRRLAYPIMKGGQRFLEGNYSLTRFTIDSTKAQQIEGLLRLSEEVLRYLLVRAETSLEALRQPAKAPAQADAVATAPTAASTDEAPVETEAVTAPAMAPADETPVQVEAVTAPASDEASAETEQEQALQPVAPQGEDQEEEVSTSISPVAEESAVEDEAVEVEDEGEEGVQPERPVATSTQSPVAEEAGSEDTAPESSQEEHSSEEESEEEEDIQRAREDG